MKPLTPQQIARLAKWVQLTREREIDCDECLHHLAEFTECDQAARDTTDLLGLIGQHLFLCPECRESFDALQRILESDR